MRVAFRLRAAAVTEDPPRHHRVPAIDGAGPRKSLPTVSSSVKRSLPTRSPTGVPRPGTVRRLYCDLSQLIKDISDYRPARGVSNVEVERRAVQRTYRALYLSRVRSNRLLGSLAWLREVAVVRFLHVEVLAARNVQYCVRRHDATPPDADQQ